MRIVSAPLYRARQVKWALSPRVSEAERAEASGVLGDGLSPLFEAMDAADQRHCLDVYRAARKAGCDDEEVLAAALIHDCGKAPSPEDGRIRLWHRVVHVALAAAWPGMLRKLAARGGGLRLLERHVERGLELAEANGASTGVLELMRAMEDGESQDSRVLLLREADNRL